MFKIKGVDEEKSLTILYVIIAVITALTCRIKVISIAVGFIELLIVLLEIIRNRSDKAMLWVVFFISTVVENVYFSTGKVADTVKIYSFEVLPIVKTYHILVIAVILYVLTIQITEDKLCKRLIALWVAALIVTLLTLALNDNDVAGTWGLTRLVIVDAYSIFLIITVFIVFYRLISVDNGFVSKTEMLILSVLKGSVIAAVILLFFHNTWRTDEGTIYLVCPLIFFWSPALLLFYNKEKKISLIIYAIISMLIQVRYTIGIPGAWWISTGIILFAFVVETFNNIVLFQRARVAYVTALFIVFILILVFGIYIDSGKNFSQGGYILYKLGTALRIFDFKSDPMAWLNGLGNSAGIRVEEIINIVLEYLKKPGFILTGKGFGGTTNHNCVIFNWNTSGAFSDIQRSKDVYSSMHTGVAEMILNFGIVGACLVMGWIKAIITAMFGKRNNPWIIIGSLYLLLFFTSYWCMLLCIPMMAYGIYLKQIEG